MRVVTGLMRFIGFLFHIVLTLFLLAVSGLALASGTPGLQFGMLPWSGSTLVYVLFFGALFGLISLILAFRGTLKPLFFLWALAVAILLVRGYVFTGYRFAPGQWTLAAWIVVFSCLAVIGAWFQWRAKAPVRAKRY
ncbi:MAG TPA: hypothetical protein VGF59_20405 [Bryobacteraceae bacterium]